MCYQKKLLLLAAVSVVGTMLVAVSAPVSQAESERHVVAAGVDGGSGGPSASALN